MCRCFLLFLLLPLFSTATNYYISNKGDDANTGTSPDKAWKSIDKVNERFFNLKPGDSVLFKRGDFFYGAVRVSRDGASGSPIVLSAYGNGANPVISGFTLLTNWANRGNGIWQAPAAMLQPHLNLVSINGMPRRIGRYPNADAPDGGFLRYDSFDANAAITDNELDEKVNWKDAEVVIRKNLWTAERCRITRHTGNTIYYTYANAGVNAGKLPPLYSGYKGYGYFFQKDVRTLDQFGEWVLDTVAHQLLLFCGKYTPASYNIRASSIDTLLNVANHQYISIDHLDFEGANMSGIYAKSAGNVTIRYCNFNQMGAKAIHIWNSPDIVIDHVTSNYALSNAIQVRNSKQANVAITNCVIKNTGIFLGMGSFFDDRDYKAISASADRNLLIANNRVDTTGLTGIQFQGSDAIIRNNVVNYYCYLLDDGGGIYTYAEVNKDAPVLYTNRLIEQNIILNGAGAMQGSVTGGKAEGIYLDGGTMHVDVRNNTIANVVNKAIATNNPSHVNITGNTCYNTGGGWGATRLNAWEQLQTFNITDNIFYSLNDQQRQANFIHSGLDQPVSTTVWEAISKMGIIDRNCYNTPNPAGFNITYAPKVGDPYITVSPLSLESWKEKTGQELHSKRPSRQVPAFVLIATIGNNLVKQGSFATDIKGIIPFGKNMQVQWDEGKLLGGKGSAKISFTSPQANRFGFIHAPVGTLTAGKKYLLRFTILGSAKQGTVKAYLRKTSAPFTNLVPAQVQVFDESVKHAEMLFDLRTTEAASFVIEVEQNSGTTLINDIELYEANAVVPDPAKQVRLEINDGAVPKNILLDAAYEGVDGVLYNNTLALAPFSSIILIRKSWKY